jgi:hypothetical protein
LGAARLRCGCLADAAAAREERRGRRGRSPRRSPGIGFGFGWLQNAWLLHARLKIHRVGVAPRLWLLIVQKTRGPVH